MPKPIAMVGASTKHRAPSESALNFLTGGGHMAEVIRSIDWSATSLGPIEGWPQSLRTTVSLCLASNFPISLVWGPGHAMIYNDGYWPICGGKHPEAMGHDITKCWASAWPVFGETFERALAGEASHLENQRMFLDRDGYLEETFFTFSFSPIRDEAGVVCGLFNPVIEETAKMLSERRIRALRDLAARTGKAKAVEEVFTLTAETIAAHDLDVPFVLLYALDAGGTTARLAASTGITGATAPPMILDLAGEGAASSWPVAEVVRTGMVVQVDDLERRVAPLVSGPYPEPPKTALVSPITLPGTDRPIAVCIAGVSSRLPFNDAYRDFFDLVAATITAAVATAHSHEEQHRRAETLAELDRAKTESADREGDLRAEIKAERGQLALRDVEVKLQMEGRYRGLLEAAPDAMVVVNQDGEIVLLNLQAEQQFGYHRDELVGQKVKNVIPEGFAERLIADGTRTAAEALAQQIGTGIELTGRRKDGSEFPIELMLSPLESAEGILVTAAIRNISVRKDAEKHLAQMEGRYRGLLEAAPDAMVVVNQDGEIVLLNLQAEQQFGYHRDELVGQKVKNVIPEGFAERLIADGTRTAAEALAQQIGTGIELTGRRKDGSEFPIELMLSPLESAEGILVTAAIRNISVRKDAEKHLAQMEGRYRGLLEAAPDAMVVVNQDGEIVLLNLQAEQQFGYHRDELVGQKVKNVIPEGFAERLIADGTRTAAEALAQQIGTGIELTGRRKDGSEFPIELMLSPLESAEGILVTAAIRNISARKDAERHLAQMEGRLQHSQKLEALGTFASGIAHEFNNTLVPILGLSYLIQMELPDGHRLREHAQEIGVAGRRARDLVRQILAFSRMGSEETSEKAPFVLEALVTEMMNTLRRVVPSTIDLPYDAKGKTTLIGSRDQLGQVLLNLVNNAAQAIGNSHGTITVHVRRCLPPAGLLANGEHDAGFVELVVADSGPGMDEVTRARIFEPFFTTKPVGEGTGLGLSVVHGIVTRHGGVIEVTSTEGATFSVKLPVASGLIETLPEAA